MTAASCSWTLAPGHAGLGGSALSVVLSQIGLEESLDVDSSKLKAAFTATQQMLAGGLLALGHDRSDGGLFSQGMRWRCFVNWEAMCRPLRAWPCGSSSALFGRVGGIFFTKTAGEGVFCDIRAIIARS